MDQPPSTYLRVFLTRSLFPGFRYISDVADRLHLSQCYRAFTVAPSSRRCHQDTFTMLPTVSASLPGFSYIGMISILKYEFAVRRRIVRQNGWISTLVRSYTFLSRRSAVC